VNTATILASLPSPPADWQYFDVGPLRVHVYALAILAGIILATWITGRRLTARGGEKGVVLDFLLWTVPLGIIFARIYHVLTHPGDYFGPDIDPLSVFYIWEGGNAIFGGLIGGALGVWLGSRQTGVRFFSFADALIPGLLVAQAAGRLGNYFNQELFGLPTTLPWGLVIDLPNSAVPSGLPADTLFHPTFLYEMIWNLAGVVILLLIERRRDMRWGKALAFYLVWYGLGRAWLEAIRLDPSETFLGIRTNIWASFAAILLGVILYVVQSRRHPGREESIYLPGREPREPDVDSKESEKLRKTRGSDAAPVKDSPPAASAKSRSAR
jgi:prolipoprotein diacylglyceryl transferase